MRKHGRSDANQALIIKALRQAGISVQPLQSVGCGCPDLLCGYLGANTLLEVKDAAQPPSGRRLTPEQQEWQAGWRGQVNVVETPEQAIRICQLQAALPF